MNSGYISSKFQKATAIAGAATMLFLVTSCTAGTTQVNAAPETSAGASPSSSPSAAATTPSGPKPGDVINGLPTKKELANDGKGDYIQTTIASDDPAFTYNPAIVEPNASSAFSEDDIKEVQKKFVTFVAEETIDSTLNDNPSDTSAQDAWWAKHKDQIDSASQAEFLAALKSNDPNQPFVFRGQHRQTGVPNYSLAHGSDVTHVNSRKITLKAIRAGVLKGKQVLGVQADVEFTLNAVVNGKPVLESSKGIVSYTFTKDASGKFLISGTNGKYTITPAVG